MVFTQDQISEFYTEEKKYYELFKTIDNIEWYNSTLYPISGGKIEEELTNFASKNPLANSNTVSSKWKHANVARYATGAPIFKDEETNTNYYIFKDRFLKIELEYLNYNTSYYLEINGYNSATTEVNAHRHFYFIGKVNGLQYRPRVQNIVSKPSDEEKIKALESEELIRQSRITRELIHANAIKLDNQLRIETQLENDAKLREQLILVDKQKEQRQKQAFEELQEKILTEENHKQMIQERNNQKYIDFVTKQHAIQQEIEIKQTKREQELKDTLKDVNNKVDSILSPILDEKKNIKDQLASRLHEANNIAKQKNNELDNKMLELINSVKQQNKSIQDSINNSQSQLSYNNELVNRLRNGVL